MWTAKLQTVYDSLEDFEQWDSIYNLAARLGFESASDAWRANPRIQGSVNASDYSVRKANKVKA